MKELLELVRSLPKISREEEEELWGCHRRGDSDARNRLVLRHIGIVFKVAKIFHSNGLSYEDLFQEGVLGLLSAIDTWDPVPDHSFYSHARYRIKRQIWDAIWDTGFTVRPKDQRPTSTISIFTPLHDDEEGDGDCIGDRLTANVPGLDDMAEENNTAAALDEALRSLSKKEETVLRRHYGIGVAERPLDSIGVGLNCSRQYVHQIEKRALARLRRQKAIRALAPC